jgi:predicted DNA-binding antitoxin AbrB/MazE fold protein
MSLAVIRMKQSIDAVFERGMFRPLQRDAVRVADGQRVRITVDDDSEPQALQLLAGVYDGLAEAEIAEVERITLDRGNFFGTGSEQ